MKVLTAQTAAKLDEQLMDPEKFAFVLEQLMELAGLSVSQAVFKTCPPTTFRRTPSVLVLSGPGNNGGDGLVAARHLKAFGYDTKVYYPKPTKGKHFECLTKQLMEFNVPVSDKADDFSKWYKSADCILDAIFGFSFKGDVREPFVDVIEKLAKNEKTTVSVDIPSSWDVDNGPAEEGCGKGFHPKVLISLTAPKRCALHFHKKGHTHYLGGRFISKELAAKYDLPEYPQSDQIVDVTNEKLVDEKTGKESSNSASNDKDARLSLYHMCNCS